MLVVGLGSTGVDTAAALVGNADKVYLSYRHGAVIVRWPIHLPMSPNGSTLLGEGTNTYTSTVAQEGSRSAVRSFYDASQDQYPRISRDQLPFSFRVHDG